MTVKLGSGTINKINLGSTEIKKAFQGLTAIHDKTGGAPPPSGDGSLADILSGVVFDLDTSKTSSYSGAGQTWSNLVTAPADGSAQTDYDVWLGRTSGVSTDDPVFVSSPTPHFNHDGGDVFGFKTKPALMQRLHWQSTSHTFIFCGNFAAVTNQGLIGTDVSVGNIPHISMIFQGTVPRILVQRSTGGVFMSTIVPTTGSTTGNFCFVISYDEITGVTSIYKNGAKFTAATVISAAEDLTPAALPILGARIGATSNVASIMLTNGSDSRAYALLNRAITDGEAAAILAEYNARHGGIFV